MERVKISQEDLTTINELKEKYNSLVLSAGTTHYELVILQDRKLKIEDQMRQLREDEDIVYQQLTAKYGEGTLSLETGELIKS